MGRMSSFWSSRIDSSLFRWVSLCVLILVVGGGLPSGSAFAPNGKPRLYRPHQPLASTSSATGHTYQQLLLSPFVPLPISANHKQLSTRHLSIGSTAVSAPSHCVSPSRYTRLYSASRDLAASSSRAFPLAAPSRSDIAAILSAAIFIAVDVLFRKLFRHWAIAFPSSLGACGAVFGLLLVLSSLQKNRPDQFVYPLLQPGAALLAKWLPVFFVPSLISLPLADSIGSATEIIKVGAVIVAGFFLTLLTTAFSVSAVRQLKSNNKKNENSSSGANRAEPETTAVAKSPAKKPFTDELFNFLCLSTGISAARAVATSGSSGSPWTALFLLSTTLNSFVFGARLPSAFNQLVHPLVTCTSWTWTAMAVMGAVTHITFREMLRQYTVRSAVAAVRSRFTFFGAGNILLFLLGPAVVSLAVSMYERRQLMRDNIVEVSTAITVSTLGGLFGTALAVRALKIASPFLRLSLLSRNITSPLAMAIAGILGADISLAVSMVVVTGLIGANFGAAILDAVGIRDGVARGLGIGAAAHGLGTAAFANEKDAFPFAAISMALTATAATVTVSIPLVRAMLVKLALGA